METKKMYEITVVEVTQYGASSSRMCLKLNSLEDCKKIIEIAKVANWEIKLTDGCFNEELVERSEAYQNFLNKEADERAAWIKSQIEKTEQINATPKEYVSKIQLPNSCKIIYERSDAHFEAHVSSRISWGLGTKVFYNGNSRSLYVYEYATKDGRIQVGKFARDMRGFFGEAEREIRPEIIRDIVKEHDEISSQIIRNS